MNGRLFFFNAIVHDLNKFNPQENSVEHHQTIGSTVMNQRHEFANLLSKLQRQTSTFQQLYINLLHRTLLKYYRKIDPFLKL